MKSPLSARSAPRNAVSGPLAVASPTGAPDCSSRTPVELRDSLYGSSSRPVLKSLTLFSQVCEINLIRNQARSPRHQIRVVLGDALSHPKQARVVFFRIVKRPQRVRTNALDVVEMKELVGDQIQKALIA